MTRVLAKDPFRALPDPKLYEGQASVDLQLADPAYPTVTPDAAEAGRAADGGGGPRGPGGGGHPLRLHRHRRHPHRGFRVPSNGFEGPRLDTVFFVSAQVSVKDADGRRPEDYSFGGARFLGELPATAVVGREAAQRPLSRLGAKKPPSAVMTLVIDNRAAGRLMGASRGPSRARRSSRSAPSSRASWARRSAARCSTSGRPAHPEGLRLAPLRRRGHRRQAAARLREGRPAQLLHRHLLREEAGHGAHLRRPTTWSGRSARSRRPRSWRTSARASWSPASSAATRTAPPATSRSACRASASAAASAPSRWAR